MSRRKSDRDLVQAGPNGRPTRQVYANVEFNFRLPDRYFDQKQKRRRTVHYAAVQGLPVGAEVSGIGVRLLFHASRREVAAER
jgi:hypothetical protein